MLYLRGNRIAMSSAHLQGTIREQDIEKKTPGEFDINEISDHRKDESDASSELKQDGVKRVEAITTVWSKELLIVMFVL